MADTFPGGGFVTPRALPVDTAETPTVPAQRQPPGPDPFYVEGMRCAVQMFAPLDGTRSYQQYEVDTWWGNVTSYADGWAQWLRARSAGAKG